MSRRSLHPTVLLLTACFAVPAAAFDFYGRSGDGVLLDFGRQPGVAPGAVFDNLQLNTFTTHTALTSDVLEGASFAQTGRLYAFADHNRGPGRGGDTDLDAPGFQGAIGGSVDIDGVTHDFTVTFQPGYTGAGRGSVGQSLEGLGRNNNPLFVAQQQQRLAYLNFQREGGGLPGVTGTFDADTDEAARTFQAAFSSGLNTTQANVGGVIGPNTAGWLNAGNAPHWEVITNPAGSNINFIPSFERYGTSWMIDLIHAAAADAKSVTGRDQRITAISAPDGYGSSCCHNTHRVGRDLDLGVDPSLHTDFGNGTLGSEEAIVVQHARAFLDAHLHHGLEASVTRILASNSDILDAINSTHPGKAVYLDGHANHLHLDIAPLGRDAPAANLLGDFNLDDLRDDADIDLLHTNLGGDPGVYNLAGNSDTVDAADVAFMIVNVLGTSFGDANLSGQVEQGDLDAVLSHWGSTAAGWATGDLNGNGQVEQGDLDQVLSHWGQGGAPDFGGAVVPEPGFVSGFALLALVRRRRSER